MMEWIQVTAEYSNAVLLAALPFTSDFAAKLQLPVPNPITVAHIDRFVCMPWKEKTGGYLTLTNGYEFWYGNGYVMGFRTPHSYYSLQNPADIPKFYGALRIKEAEALRLSRDSLEKLGYTLQQTFADQEPEISLPPQIGTNIVPHYRFKWHDPVFNTTAVDIEIDGNRGVVENLWLGSLFFSRDPPHLAVEPKPLNPPPPITPALSNSFVKAILPKIAGFAKRLRLDLSLTVTAQAIRRVQFLDLNQTAFIQLTNGFWFTSEKGDVRGFNSPDSIYGRHPSDRPCPLETYLGKSAMNENQVIELARDAIQRLGHELEHFGATRPPAVSSPKAVGSYVVPRYLLQWFTHDARTGATLSVAWVEVDACRKTLKYAYVSREPVIADTTALSK